MLFQVFLPPGCFFVSQTFPTFPKMVVCISVTLSSGTGTPRGLKQSGVKHGTVIGSVLMTLFWGCFFEWDGLVLTCGARFKSRPRVCRNFIVSDSCANTGQPFNLTMPDVGCHSSFKPIFQVFHYQNVQIPQQNAFSISTNTRHQPPSPQKHRAPDLYATLGLHDRPRALEDLSA